MKISGLLLLAGIALLTSCDQLSSRQSFVERNVIGRWQDKDETTNILGVQVSFSNVVVEFFPDRTYTINMKVDVAGTSNNGGVMEEGTWSVSEDGRFRMSSNKILGMGISRTGQMWIFKSNCRGKQPVLMGRFDDDMNFHLKRLN